MKKLFALLLALAMVLSMVACGAKAPAETTAPSTEPAATEPATEPAPEIETGYSVDYSSNSVYAGAVTTAQGAVGGGEVGYDIYAGTEGKDYTDPEFYTYTDYVGGTTDMNWSTHNWETTDDNAILYYISSPFYNFYLNSTADGWSIGCEMAAELPIDVTSEYVGQYGIEEGDTLKAWKIVLNPNATWENGEPINADSFVYSAQELLDPVMKNRRADSLYAGDFQIYGAKNYVYQGQTAKMENAVNAAYTMADLTIGEDGIYVTPNGEKVYLAIGFALSDWLGGNSLADYVGAYGADYFDLTNWDALVALMDDKGLVALTEETYALFVPVIAGNPAWGETEENVPSYLVYDETYGEYAWEDVGFLKTGEYELVMITVHPIENPNYYVPYNLSATYLVYEPMWEACKRYWDANGNEVTADSADIATITTNYGTSKDTTMSYGPYVLSYFELDKQYTLDRNENWYGYSDGNHLGFWQTDRISVQVIVDHSTALLAFEAGELMSVGLQAEDMEKYGSSDYLHYTPESYTTKLTFNTDVNALTAHGTGSQVLANATLRKAFALAIDRATFCSSFTAGHLPGFGLLNTMYVYDPFTGASYRDTDGAKDAIVQLYGLTYGDDGEYGDLDEAYEAVTGYDPTLANTLMAQAYDECVAAGLYDGTSNITLELCVYNSDEVYVKMFNFLNDALVAACAGTGFEGKLTMVMKVDADYYNTMYSGNTDIIFSTWGGAAYSPYTMLNQCYCDASDGSGNQMEFGFDTTKIMVTINVDGLDFTDSLKNWADWAGGMDVTLTSNDGTMTLGTFGSYDADTRSTIFAKLEYSYLAFFATTPIYYRNAVSVASQKISYPVDNYVDLVAFGGIEFVTYNYTDAQWAEVAGTLTY